jgi:hypothetical protein
LAQFTLDFRLPRKTTDNANWIMIRGESMSVIAEPISSPMGVFAGETAKYLWELYFREPVLATYMGLRECDSFLPDRRGFAHDQSLRCARAYLYGIDRMPVARFTNQTRSEYRAVRANIQKLIVLMEHANPWYNDPALYVEEALSSLQLLNIQENAIEGKLSDALVRRLKGFEELFSAAQENIRTPLRALIELGMSLASGAIVYLNQIKLHCPPSVFEPEWQIETRDAQESAIQALKSFSQFLHGLLTSANAGDLSCGVEVYDYMVSLSGSGIRNISALETELRSKHQLAGRGIGDRAFQCFVHILYHTRKASFEEVAKMVSDECGCNLVEAAEKAARIVRQPVESVLNWAGNTIMQFEHTDNSLQSGAAKELCAAVRVFLEGRHRAEAVPF